MVFWGFTHCNFVYSLNFKLFLSSVVDVSLVKKSHIWRTNEVHDLSGIYEYTNTAMDLIGKFKLAIGCYRLRFLKQTQIAVCTFTVHKGRNTNSFRSCSQLKQKL